MHEWESLSHVWWECTYHVVIIPKYRRKALYGKLRHRIGRILRELCQQRGVELLVEHCMPDHIHMCLSIPPKYSVAHAIGFLKGKSAVRIHRDLLHERRMTGLHFRAIGYCVSAVGLDEQRIRQYIREQGQLESGQGELDLKQNALCGPSGAFLMWPPPTGASRCARAGLPNATPYGRGRSQETPRRPVPGIGASLQIQFLNWR